MIQKQRELVGMERLFQLAGVNYLEMEPNEVINIENKNIKIKSFNHITAEIEFKKVISLVRKEDSPTKRVFSELTREEIFRGTGAHRVYALIDGSGSWSYKSLDSLGQKFVGFNKEGKEETFCIESTSKVEPILDIEVDDNKNYFTNKLLSHNTQPGGKALKYQASIRLDIRKIESLSDSKGEATGIKCRLKGVKNKTARPMVKREFTINFGEGIDIESEQIDSAIEKGFIHKSSSWFSIPETGDKFNGKTALVEFLNKEDNIELKKSIIDRVLGNDKPNEVSMEELIEREEIDLQEE